MSENDTYSSGTERPSLSSYDWSEIPAPADGILYLAKRRGDGFWLIYPDGDMALQAATGYPVGELIDYEEMGDYEDAERGELRALFVGEDRSDEPDYGVSAVGGYVCQNFRAHDEEVEMVSGPFDGVICPECGRATGGPDFDVPFTDDGPRNGRSVGAATEHGGADE